MGTFYCSLSTFIFETLSSFSWLYFTCRMHAFAYDGVFLDCCIGTFNTLILFLLLFLPLLLSMCEFIYVGVCVDR